MPPYLTQCAQQTVLDGDRSLPPQRGGTAAPLLFGPCVLWPNGCMDQGATWHGCRPRPRPRDVRWDLAPPNKGEQEPSFSAHVYCGQTAAWIKVPLGTEVNLGPGDVEIVSKMTNLGI